jgi:hypothetical protein
MGQSTFDQVTNVTKAWNAGQMLGAKRALKPSQVWAIRFWFDHEGRLRDRALFDFAIDSNRLSADPFAIASEALHR